MYLSRLILNPRSRQVRREVSEPYQMHRTIMRAFPGADDGGPGRVLFRLDSPPPGYTPGTGLTLLVQSEDEPDWSWLVDQQGYLAHTGLENPAIKPLGPTIAVGQRLAFRLRANPTVKRDGKRCGLYREDEQRAWLERKGKQGGFAVLAADVRDEGMAYSAIHRQDGNTHRARWLAVRFDGLLQVTDPHRFLDTLRQGVGSGKGLGFGLFSLARA